MMVFSILLALLVIDRDFVHEFGSRGDLIVPCCTDLKTATQFSFFFFFFFESPPGGKRNNAWQHASSRVLSGIKMKSVSVSIK